MNTTYYSRFSTIFVIAASALALPGCMTEVDEVDDAMADMEAVDGDQADAVDSDAAEESEDVAEAEQALLANVTLTQWQTVTSATWSFWGWTDIEFTNNTGSTGYASLQAGAGAPEYVSVPPYGKRHIWRQYAAMPVHITNVAPPTLKVVVW